MSNTILTEAFRDLRDQAETPILPKLQFDYEIAQMHQTFNDLYATYNQLVNKKDPEVYRYNQNLNYFTYLYNHADSSKDFLAIVNEHRIEFSFVRLGSGESTSEKVIRLYREKYQEKEHALKLQYDELVASQSTEVGDWDFISAQFWFQEKWKELFNQDTYISYEEVDSVKKLFLFVNKQKRYTIDEECMKVFESEQRKYMTPFWNIMSTLEKYLRAEATHPNTKYVVNVGKIDCTRNYRVNRGLTDYNEITIGKDGDQYSFFKTSDVKQLKCRIIIVYLISSKSFIKLMVNEDLLLSRSEYLIKRDIKKIEISEDNFLKIHFHRYSDWETLILKTYKDALELQKYITAFR